MSKEQLQALRLFVPGVLFILFLIPLVVELRSEIPETLNEISKFMEFSPYFIIILTLPFSIIYYTLNIRGYVWKPFKIRVSSYIKEQLLCAAKVKFKSEKLNVIKKSEKLKIIFYGFIDNDESLKDKAKTIRLNGLIWSSLVDLTILSFFAAVVYCILSFTIHTKLIILTVFFLFLCVFSLLFTWLITEYQMKLANSQIQVIIQTKQDELQQKISSIISNI